MGKLTERLSDPARSGVYRTTKPEIVEDAVRGTRLNLVRIDLGGAADKDALLRSIAAALGFPEWFGGNWDALEDALGDLSWFAAEGHVLLFTAFDELAADDIGILIDILRSSAEFWAARGRPFFAVLVDSSRTLALADLFREQ